MRSLGRRRGESGDVRGRSASSVQGMVSRSGRVWKVRGLEEVRKMVEEGKLEINVVGGAIKS